MLDIIHCFRSFFILGIDSSLVILEGSMFNSRIDWFSKLSSEILSLSLGVRMLFDLVLDFVEAVYSCARLSGFPVLLILIIKDIVEKTMS